MIYLLVAIINLIFGILSFLSLLSDPATPGYSIIFIIASVLTVLGLTGIFLWLKSVITSIHDQKKPLEDELTKSWFQLTRSFNLVLILGFVFRIFIMQPFVVEGNSMETNFHDQQILLVDKISYHLREPERGEVIIFKAPPSPKDDYIKRVIAKPGETVKIEDNSVYINDQPLNETYLDSTSVTQVNNDPDMSKTMILGPDEYFVMGDNREHSSDSREWGTVPKNFIIGRPIFSVYPVSELGLVHYPETFFKLAKKPFIISAKNALKSF